MSITTRIGCQLAAPSRRSYEHMLENGISKDEDNVIMFNVELSLQPPKQTKTPLLRCRSRSKTSDLGISIERALWFLQLPQKLRRFHFSTEEQAYIIALLSTGTLKWSDAYPKKQQSSLTLDSPSNDIEAPVKHYKDAEVRRKLQSLTTPEGFDEAIEFGFPTDPYEPELHESSTHAVQPNSFIPPPRTSSRHRNTSRRSDGAPSTPHALTRASSRPSGPPALRGKPSEMTLRLTTSPGKISGSTPSQPDLEIEQRPRSSSHTALALPELPPFTDNVTGSCGLFAAVEEPGRRLRKQKSEVFRGKGRTW